MVVQIRQVSLYIYIFIIQISGILTNFIDDQLTSNLLPVVVQTLSEVLRVDAVEILRADVLGISQVCNSCIWY
jgi:hypothetical protein